MKRHTLAELIFDETALTVRQGEFDEKGDRVKVIN